MLGLLLAVLLLLPVSALAQDQPPARYETIEGRMGCLTEGALHELGEAAGNRRLIHDLTAGPQARCIILKGGLPAEQLRSGIYDRARVYLKDGGYLDLISYETMLKGPLR